MTEQQRGLEHQGPFVVACHCGWSGYTYQLWAPVGSQHLRCPDCQAGFTAWPNSAHGEGVMARYDEVEDGMGFAGLVPTSREIAAHREALRHDDRIWDDAIEVAAQTIERELGDRHEIAARARTVRALKRNGRSG